MRFEPGLIGEIRKRRAATSYLVAYDDQETELERFHLTKHRQTCSQAVDAFKELSWVAVRFYDSKDGIIHVYKRQLVDEDPPSELESLSAPGTSRMAELASMANLIARSNHDAQRLVLAEVRLQTGPMMDTITRLLDRQTERDESRERQHDRAMAAVHRLSMDLATAHAHIAGVEQLRAYETALVQGQAAAANGGEVKDLPTRVLEHYVDQFMDAAADKKPDDGKAPASDAPAAEQQPEQREQRETQHQRYQNRTRDAFRNRNSGPGSRNGNGKRNGKAA
jgi:hypothetical protein